MLCRETVDLIRVVIQQGFDTAQPAQRLLKIAAGQLDLEGGALVAIKSVNDALLQSGHVG